MISEVNDALKQQGLALVRIEISGTDFKKSLKSQDIGLEKEVERELATLGRKSVFSNEYPKLLRNNKDQSYTYLDKMGVRFGTFGTWAVPVNIYNDVIDFLEQKKQEREAIKMQLLISYEAELEQFAKRAEEMRPGFGKIVKQNAYNKSHIETQIQYVIEAQQDIMSSVSISAVQGLSRMAKDYETKLLKKAKDTKTKPTITRFTRNVLEEMRDYCLRFVFLTPVLNKAAEIVDATIDTLPPTVVKGHEYSKETSRLLMTLKLLRTPDELDGIEIEGVELTEQDKSSVENHTVSDESDEYFDEDGNIDSDDDVTLQNSKVQTSTSDLNSYVDSNYFDDIAGTPQDVDCIDPFFEEFEEFEEFEDE